MHGVESSLQLLRELLDSLHVFWTGLEPWFGLEQIEISVIPPVHVVNAQNSTGCPGTGGLLLFRMFVFPWCRGSFAPIMAPTPLVCAFDR